MSLKVRVNEGVHNLRPAQSEQATPAAGGHTTGFHGKHRCADSSAASHSDWLKIGSKSAVLLVRNITATLFFWHRQSRSVYIQCLWLNAGMAADPLLHVVVKLQGTEELMCYMKAATVAAQVFKTCKVRAKCQEGTLQDASGMDLVEDGTELSAGTYFFTPAESTGMSSISTL